MSTELISMPQPVGSPLSMRELSEVLVKHYGIHEGKFDLMIEFQIGMGAVGPDPANVTPGAMIGVSRVGLIPVDVMGPTTVDAAIANPAKKASRKAAA
jgi:hypothetical protein